MDAKRLLAPLEVERDAIRGLSEYRTAAELGSAIGKVAGAVDRVLRLLLREDRSAPDAARMGALSEDRPAEEVVVALRRADTITMELAGGFAQLREAAGRARDGAVTAADADVARDVLRQLAEAVAAADRPAAVTGPEVRAPETAAAVLPPSGRRAGWRFPVLAAVLVAVAGASAWIVLRGRTERADTGAAAFAAGRLDEAERIFRRRTEARGGVTDWLYLGRILRRTGRFDEAAAALRTAVDADPADADVRRELGWLFLDLGRPAAAGEQFHQAVEIAPGESLNWIGLVQALRAAGDPSAEEWLSRAPAEARTRLEPAPPARPAR